MRSGSPVIEEIGSLYPPPGRAAPPGRSFFFTQAGPALFRIDPNILPRLTVESLWAKPEVARPSPGKRLTRLTKIYR